MANLIDRQAAMDAVWSLDAELRPSAIDEILNRLNALPSAEPERKKGNWIYGENDGQDGWYCSECKGFIPWDYDFYGLNNIDFIKDFKTCPFCDSKMISYTGSENKGEKQ